MEIEDLDIDSSSSSYSGTFRWKKTKHLPSMPIMAVDLLKKGKVQLDKGWKDYFLSRGKLSHVNNTSDSGDYLIEYAHSDLSLVDCLSLPLSISYFLKNASLGLTLSDDSRVQYEKLTIICIGCSEKAEERVLRETNCFMELGLALPAILQFEVWLVGPEMSGTANNVKSDSLPSQTSSDVLTEMHFHTFQGTVSSFFRSHPECLGGSSTLVVGFNCGFGNFENPLPRRYDLFLSWLPDLIFLTSTKLPVVFFCANDYADLLGEMQVMISLLGARFINPPAENSFAFASTMIPPEDAGYSGHEYARGNAFFYAVQSCDRARRSPLLQVLKKQPLDKTTLTALIPYLSKSALSTSIEKVGQYLVPGKLELVIIPSRTLAVTSAETASSIVPRVAEASIAATTPTSTEQVPQEAVQPLALESSCISASPPVQPPAHAVQSLSIEQHVTEEPEATLMLEVKSSNPSVMLKHTQLDLHRSGEHLRIVCVDGSGAVVLEQQQELTRKVSTRKSMVAKYSTKSNSLSIKLPLIS
jgi:hypothetical protein